LGTIFKALEKEKLKTKSRNHSSGGVTVETLADLHGKKAIDELYEAQKNRSGFKLGQTFKTITKKMRQIHSMDNASDFPEEYHFKI